MRVGQTPSKIRVLLQLLRASLSTLACQWIGRTGKIRTLRIEDFSEDDHMTAAGSMATAGRSPKHPGSEEDSLDIAALLHRAADRLIACMDTLVDSMMDRLEKRIDGRIDSKLGPVG